MPFDGDEFAFWGKLIIEEFDKLLNELLDLSDSESKSDPFDLCDKKHVFLPGYRVGILGGGIGGLYTALILDSLDIEYEILEASDRVGGRIETHRFEQGEKYDYYEAGAMRFPLPEKDADGKYKNGTMKRLAELIEYGPLNEGPDPLKDRLIPYYYSARDAEHPGFKYFNGRCERIKASKGDSANSKTEPKEDFNAKLMGIDPAYVAVGPDAIYEDAIQPFVDVLKKDYENGTKHGWALLKANDSYSIRGYLASKYLPSRSLGLPPQHLSNDVINWCNLFSSSTGAFDAALTAGVFTAMAFGKFEKVNWQCFDGGSETFIKKIEGYLKSKGVTVQKNQRVTAIREDPFEIPTNATSLSFDGSAEVMIELTESTYAPLMAVTVRDPDSTKTETKYYSHVISTLPLPVLRTIDLNDAGLSILQKNALRGINYGPAIKIAILFKSNWWTTKLGIVGGQSYTDLPIRTIVYPSYGVDSSTPPKVLIASFTSTTDAFRLGALSAHDEVQLKELVLRNLAEAHGKLDPSITYEYLSDQYVDMHVKNWNLDVHSMGAYALFTPGQFENLYAALNVPAANGCLHFAGDAISTRHGWAVGALDSAWKSVFEFLKVTAQKDKIALFKEKWAGNAEWTERSRMVKGGPEHDLLDEHAGLSREAAKRLEN